MPANAEYIADYFKQVTAPLRVIEKDRNNNDVAVYREFGKPDHYFHSEIYDFIALKIIQLGEYNIYRGGADVGKDREIELIGFGEDRMSAEQEF